MYFHHTFRHLSHVYGKNISHNKRAKQVQKMQKKYTPLPVVIDIYTPATYKHKEQNHIIAFISRSQRSHSLKTQIDLRGHHMRHSLISIIIFQISLGLKIFRDGSEIPKRIINYKEHDVFLRHRYKIGRAHV